VPWDALVQSELLRGMRRVDMAVCLSSYADARHVGRLAYVVGGGGAHALSLGSLALFNHDVMVALAPVCSRLRFLDLSCVSLTEEGALALADVLDVEHVLRSLRLPDFVGEHAFSELMFATPRLTSLVASCSNHTHVGKWERSVAWTTHPELRSITLRFCGRHTDGSTVASCGCLQPCEALSLAASCPHIFHVSVASGLYVDSVSSLILAVCCPYIGATCQGQRDVDVAPADVLAIIRRELARVRVLGAVPLDADDQLLDIDGSTCCDRESYGCSANFPVLDRVSLAYLATIHKDTWVDFTGD
jgi:hypothetical protein